MKKILVMAFAAMVLVCTAGSAHATFWVPTESGAIDVGYGWATGSGTFAIFDDSFTLGSTANSSDYLSLVYTGDTITFVQSGSGWNLTSTESGSTFTLSGSNTFQLAWQPSVGSNWYADTSYAKSSYGHYKVLWNVGNSSASIGQFDAAPVPIPPSAIMLFSGLLGLVGVRRMRRDG